MRENMMPKVSVVIFVNPTFLCNMAPEAPEIIRVRYIDMIEILVSVGAIPKLTSSQCLF